MEQRLRVAHILFIFLPVFLLASPVYASMGDINICFPFFLLLAALMAAMLAQGKSPLIGFDISTIRPPAQIRSTSYHFKSFGAGGYETEAALRSKMGGGNILTRAAGWTTNKVAQGTAKAVSAATKGKHGSEIAKRGWAPARTMSERGMLYAVTKHSQRAQALVRGAGKVVSKVPIVRPRWRGFGKGGEGKRGAISRLIPIGKKVSHKGELAAKTGLLGGGYQAHYQKEKYVRMDEKLEAVRERNVTQGKVTSLRTQLKKLGEGKTKKEQKQIKKKEKELTKAEKELRAKKRNLKTVDKEIAVYEDARKWASEYRKTLADHAGVKGILLAPVYPVAVGAGLIAAGAMLPARGAKRKLEKQIVGSKTVDLQNDLLDAAKGKLNATELARLKEHIEGKGYLTNKSSEKNFRRLAKKAGFSDIKIEELIRLDRRYSQLSGPSAFSTIFRYGEEGRKAKDLARGIGKSALYNSTWGLANQFLPYESLRSGFKKMYDKPHVIEREKNLQDNKSLMKDKLESLTKSTMTNADKVKTLREVAELQKRIPKQARSGPAIRLRDWKGVRKALLNRNQKELNEAHKDVKNNLVALTEFYRNGGKTKSSEEKRLLGNLKESIKRRDTIIEVFGIPAEAKSLEDRQLKSDVRKNTPIEKALDKARTWLKDENNLGPGQGTPGNPSFDRDRQTHIALAKFLDTWRESKQQSRGKSGLMNTPVNLINFGISGIEKAQEVRHIASVWENQLGPMLATIEREKAKSDKLKKLIKMSEEEEKKRARLKNLKNWFSNKSGIRLNDSLPAKKDRLEDKIQQLSGEKDKITDTQKKAKLEQQIKKKENELWAIDASISRAKSEIKKSTRKIDDTANFLLANEAQLAYRQREALKKGTDELSINVRSKIEKLDKSIEKNRQKMEGINQKMEDLEQNETNKPEYAKDPAKMRIALGLVHDSKEYKKLQKEFSTIQNDVNKKIKKEEDLNKSISDERVRLNDTLKEARKKTEMKIGEDAVIKERDKIAGEVKILRMSAKNPNIHSVGLMTGESYLGTNPDISKNLEKYAKDKKFGKDIAKMIPIQENLEKTQEASNKKIKEIDEKIKSLEQKKEDVLYAANISPTDTKKIRKNKEIMDSNKEIKVLKKDREKSIKDMKEIINKADEDLMKSREALVRYYKEHTDDYLNDIKQSERYRSEAMEKLKKKWDELPTFNAATWLRNRMDQVGDPNWTRETGQYRDFFELTMLTNPAAKERYKDLIVNDKGLKDRIYRDNQVLQASLYISNTLFMRVIDVQTGYKYDTELEGEIKKLRESCPEYAKQEAKLIDVKIKMITEGELKQAKDSHWTSEEKKLNERISQLEAEKEKWMSVASKPSSVTYTELEKAEDKLIRTANIHQVAELLQREEDSKTIGGLMDEDTRKRLRDVRNKFPESDKLFWYEAKKWAGLNEASESKRMEKLMYADYENKMIDKRREVKDVSSEIDKIRNKPEYLNNQPMSAKDSEDLKSLLSERKEMQRELRGIYDDWKTNRDYYRDVNEPFRTANKFAGPGSEKEMDKYLEESAEDTRKRLWASRFEPIAEPVSKAVETLSKFATHHGGKLILAATIAAPYVVLPIAGAGAAAAVTFGGAGIFGAKSYLRGSDQDTDADRVTREIIAWSSHLTGRGSGSPPSDWEGAWRSQRTGTEYITRALRLNEYGEIKARKETMDLPDVGLPWYIRWAKVPVEGATSSASIIARRAMLRMEWWAGEEEVKRLMAENPSYIPEIKNKIQYQYVQPFGAAGPTIFPKQAREMLEYRISLTGPLQEEAAHVVVMRKTAPDPLGLYLGSSDYNTGYRAFTGANYMMGRSRIREDEEERRARQQQRVEQLEKYSRFGRNP